MLLGYSSRATAQFFVAFVIVVVGAFATPISCGSDQPLPKGNYAITGVKVAAIDRTRVDGKTFDNESTKLTHWIRFDVRTKSERLSGTEKLPFEILNPIDDSKTSLTLDKPIKFQGKNVPAGANLLKYKKFDGARYNVSMPTLSPLAIRSVRIQSDFLIPADTYAVTFKWVTAKGKVFSGKVKVHIDVNLNEK